GGGGTDGGDDGEGGGAADSQVNCGVDVARATGRTAGPRAGVAPDPESAGDAGRQDVRHGGAGDEAGAVVGHDDGIGGGAAWRVGATAVALEDAEVGDRGRGVGVGGAVVGTVGVGGARRVGRAGGVDQVARGRRVDGG